MNLLDSLRQKALTSPKKIIVKVECRTTGKISNEFDCGVNQQAADAKEESLLQTVELDKFHVYQSITA